MRLLMIASLIFLVTLAGCSRAENDLTVDQAPNEQVGLESGSINESDQMMMKADLVDVTDGVTVAGIVNTKGNTTGTAVMTQSDAFLVEAKFGMLPELGNDYFYEGWLVRQDPPNVISTGEAVPGGVSGEWVNEFSSEQSYFDHDKYVLTLEPRDGDPAPADHILDGTFSEVMQ